MAFAGELDRRGQRHLRVGGPRPGDGPHAADRVAASTLPLVPVVAARGEQVRGPVRGAEHGGYADVGELLGGDDVIPKRWPPQKGENVDGASGL